VCATDNGPWTIDTEIPVHLMPRPVNIPRANPPFPLTILERGRMPSRFAIVAALLLLALTARAERLNLKDGTTVDGVVFDQGDKYWVKTPDGGTRTIPKSDVESRGTPKPTAAAAAAPTPASPAKPGSAPTPAAAAAESTPLSGGAAFTATQRRAQAATTALAAV